MFSISGDPNHPQSTTSVIQELRDASPEAREERVFWTGRRSTTGMGGKCVRGSESTED